VKKKIGTIILSLIIVGGLLLLSTGGKIASVMLLDYSISKDGNVMTLKVGVASSMGYIRTLKENQEENKKYITFYSTYGLNSNIGAKSEFQIDLNPSCNEIYFYRGNDGYVLLLHKNKETNDWELVR
jgi:hypothetical protein